jgi:hypothetical protein
MKKYLKKIYLNFYPIYRDYVVSFLSNARGAKFFSVKFVTKKRLGIFAAATIPFYVCIGSGMFLFDPSGEKKEIVLVAEAAVNPSNLSEEGKMVYMNLGPIYQKIYILALSSEERTRVNAYVRRGQTPYEAIDTILRSEERKYLRAHPKKIYQSPAEKATAKNTKNYSVF